MPATVKEAGRFAEFSNSVSLPVGARFFDFFGAIPDTKPAMMGVHTVHGASRLHLALFERRSMRSAIAIRACQTQVNMGKFTATQKESRVPELQTYDA